MAWTKSNYPVAMKNLPASVRTKAMQIANAILKENKKIKEVTLIAIAIRKAKAEKPGLNKGASKKRTSKKATPKRKAAPQKGKSNKPKSKSAAPTKRKATNKKATVKAKAGAKKIKATPKAKKKAAATSRQKNAPVQAKKVKRATAKTYTGVPDKKVRTANKLQKEKLNADNTQRSELTGNEVLQHGENLHFIPEKGDAPPLNTFEAHQLENILHAREKVALNQENKKVSQAMALRKNFKNTYRHRGGR